MNDFQTGLLVAAIGMGLVFAVIMVLWGLMVLLVRLTSKREESPAKVIPEMKEIKANMVLPDAKREIHQKAAALAVAVALKFQAAKMDTMSQSQEAEASLWQMVARTRQVQKQLTRGRRV